MCVFVLELNHSSPHSTITGHFSKRGAWSTRECWSADVPAGRYGHGGPLGMGRVAREAATPQEAGEL